MTFIEGFSKPAILAYATNWIFGIGVIQYPLGKFHPRISLVYATTTVCIYCALAGCAYPHILDLRIAQNYIVIKILYYSNIVIVVSYVALGWSRSKGLRVCVFKLIIADDLLEKIGVPKNYAVMYRRYIMQICIGSLFIIVFLTLDSITTLSNISLNKVLTAFVVSYPVIVMFVSDSGFITIIRKVKFYFKMIEVFVIVVRIYAFFFNSHISYKFRNLNKLLKTMSTSTKYFPQHTKIMKFHHSNLQNYLIKDHSSVMKTARQAHLELVETSLLANDLYGLQILLSVAVALIMITVEVYYAFTSMRDGKEAHELHSILALSAIWMAYYGIKIYVFSWICTRCTQNALDTGDIINELYDEPFISTETQQEIRTFIIQLLKVRVHFTAFGFIEIDLSLIRVMIGSITTYLMILIQFRNMTDITNCGRT